MRKRIYNWQGQRFGYIWLQGEPGQSLEKQSQGLFDRAGPELASLGLALDKNVVRTRVYGRTRDARNVVSAARGRAFSGQARATTSSWERSMRVHDPDGYTIEFAEGRRGHRGVT
jgi:hypothetical protein